jgi:hypothetical protein
MRCVNAVNIRYWFCVAENCGVTVLFPLRLALRLVAAEEGVLNWNKWFRQTHRWVSIAFTADVIINGVMVAQKRYSNTMGLSAVAILAVLFITGLYLFALPYFSRWRG